MAVETSISSENVFEYDINLFYTLKGELDASISPGFPAAIEGDAYYIKKTGLIGGKEVEISTLLIAKKATPTGDDKTVGSNWHLFKPSKGKVTILNRTIELKDFGTPFDADDFEIFDHADNTKKFKVDVSLVSTGTTRTLIIPNKDGTIALISDLTAHVADFNAHTSDLSNPHSVTQAQIGINFAEGSIPFAGNAGNIIEDNANLFWDYTNKRLGIGTNTPEENVHIKAGGNATLLFESTSGVSILILKANTSTKLPQMIFQDGAIQIGKILIDRNSSTLIVGAVKNDFIMNARTNKLHLATNEEARLTVTQDGDVGIKNINPLATLDVIGDARFGDSVTNYSEFSSNGNLTFTGTARVMKSIDIEPALATRPAANPPAEGTEANFQTHDFDASTDESVFFHLEIPHEYTDAGTIHVHFDFFVDTAPASAQGVVWGVEYKKLSVGDNFDFSSGTTTTYTTTAVTTGTPANDKKVHQSAEINLTTSGFVAGDYILLRLFRDADGTGGTDDFTGDARVIDYHIEYLTDKLGEV